MLEIVSLFEKHYKIFIKWHCNHRTDLRAIVNHEFLFICLLVSFFKFENIFGLVKYYIVFQCYIIMFVLMLIYRFGCVIIECTCLFIDQKESETLKVLKS